MNVRNWLRSWKRSQHQLARPRLAVHRLEDRTVPATHTWDAGGTTVDWSDAGNWDAAGVPVNDPNGVFIVMPINDVPIAQDIPNLTIRQIIFTNPGSIEISLGQPLTFDVDPTNPNISNVSGNNRIFNGTINLNGTQPVGINVDGGLLTIDSVMNGTAGLEKQGTGRLRLGGNNTGLTAGLSLILDGTVEFTHGNAFGNTPIQLGFVGVAGAPTVLAAADGLTLPNTILAEVPGAVIGSVDDGGANHLTEFSGSVFVNSASVTLRGGSSDRTTFSGSITGDGGLQIEATDAGNRIVLDNLDPNNDFLGDVTVANGAVLQLSVFSTAEQIPDTASITLNGNSDLHLVDISETLGTLTGAGTVTARQGTNTLTFGADDGSGTLTGGIDDIFTSTLSLVKTGNGVQTLSGPITIEGSISVVAGDLVIDGNATAASVTASGDGWLRGTGDVNAPVLVQAGGAIVPGSNAVVGALNVIGDTTFQAGSAFDVRVNGITFNTFDVLSVTGTVSLGNATLGILDTVVIGAPITILDNDGTDAIVGTFAGLAEGAVVQGANGRRFSISYVGGSGNDVTLSPLPPFEGHGPMIVVGGDLTQGGIYQFEPVGLNGAFEDVGFFKPFGVTPNIGMRTYAVDVNNDNIPDTVAVTGPGTPIRVMVMSGVDNTTVLVQPFDPFGGNFTGGGFVTGGDFDGDGYEEFIVTPDQGGGPRVSMYELQPNGTVELRANFFGIDDQNFFGGVRAAVGDMNRDGIPEIAVGAGFLGGPRTAIFDGFSVVNTNTPTRLIGDFFAFPGKDAETLRNGVFLTLGDIDGDGVADLIAGGGPGGAPRVFILSGDLIAAGQVATAQTTPIANFFVAGNANDRGGIRLSTVDADGDNRADLVTGSGDGSLARVRVYLGADINGGGGEPLLFQELAPLGNVSPFSGLFVG